MIRKKAIDALKEIQKSLSEFQISIDSINKITDGYLNEHDTVLDTLQNFYNDSEPLGVSLNALSETLEQSIIFILDDFNYLGTSLNEDPAEKEEAEEEEA